MTVFRRCLPALALAGLMLAAPAGAFCFKEAGARYHQDPKLLRAIAIVESSLNPKAVGKNIRKGKVASRDLGLMQINDTHIPELRALGVIKNRQELLTNPCLNVQVGAWILARSLKKCGISWECLGSYNAGFARNNSARRLKYARKVYTTYLALLSRRPV